MRVRGKHDDIDQVGRTPKHATFFEMLGNFSFGDYFKRDAIVWAWELLTEVLGLDGEQLWVTVYTTDDEAADLWADVVGVPRDAHPAHGGGQLLGDGRHRPVRAVLGDPFRPGLRMGGRRRPGGRRRRTRYVELWNLVFQTYDRQASGELVPLPKPGIDTGAGFRADAHHPAGRSARSGRPTYCAHWWPGPRR